MPRYFRSSILLPLLLVLLNLLATKSFSQSRNTPSAKTTPDFVRDAAVDDLIDKPAHLFNLQSKTIRFLPGPEGGYTVETLSHAAIVTTPTLLSESQALPPFNAKAWKINLPFSLPFAGKRWNQVFVNLNGNISFEKPEGDYYPQRDPWPDGGMISMAAVIDSRSAAGMEQMIAPLWGPYDSAPANSQINIKLDSDSLAVTWNVNRVHWGQQFLGTNTFQVRLFRSGVIEIAYPRIAEHDGIVGLFPGHAVPGRQLQHWQNQKEARDSAVEIDTADVYDAGSTLAFVLTMKNPVLTRVDEGLLGYRCHIDTHGRRPEFGVFVDTTAAPRMDNRIGSSPRTGGFQIQDNRLVMYISKSSLPDDLQFQTDWDVTWWGKKGGFSRTGHQPVDATGLSPGQANFAAATVANTGNIFEVFHYPLVSKNSERFLDSVYKQFPPTDDIAIVFTDFRMDDLFGQGGAISTNVPVIKGIGKAPPAPESMAAQRPQMSMATTWLGGPLFDLSGGDSGHQWFNFAHAVCWIAHESTHRWGMELSFQNPLTGREEKLFDKNGHWLDGLNTAVAYSVAPQYQNHPTLGGSIMGGAAWRENPDRTFSKNDFPYGEPSGYSPLDLYIMGMAPPEKIPPTFLLENLKDLGNNRFSATKVPVRMTDILSVMGPRLPAAADAQKNFQMVFYLIHEPGKTISPATLTQARRLSLATADYFSRATGGAMIVRPPPP